MTSLSQKDTLQTCPDTQVPQPFVFNTVQYQNSANTVYNHKEAYNIRKNAAVTGKTYKFKTDYERMQALIGCYGVNSALSTIQ